MGFTLTGGWGDNTLTGSVRITPLPSGQPVYAQIVKGELQQLNGTAGVPLPTGGVTGYTLVFEGVSQGGSSAAIHPVTVTAFAEGSTGDLGALVHNAHTKVVPRKA